MKNEEAIKILEAIDIRNLNQRNAVSVAIEALKNKSAAEDYRTPKTPININGYDYYECPTCGRLFEKTNITGKPAFCKKCGQALDWRDWLVAEGDID